MKKASKCKKFYMHETGEPSYNIKLFGKNTAAKNTPGNLTARYIFPDIAKYSIFDMSTIWSLFISSREDDVRVTGAQITAGL